MTDKRFSEVSDEKNGIIFFSKFTTEELFEYIMAFEQHMPRYVKQAISELKNRVKNTNN